MTRDAHLAAKPYLTEARRTMTPDEWETSKTLANHIKADEYIRAEQVLELFKNGKNDLENYFAKCKEYDNIPDDVNTSADDPVLESSPISTEEATSNNSKGFTIDVNASNPTASVKSNTISIDPKQNKLLEARVLALQERCDMLLKTLGDCEKEKQDVKDACGRLNGELVAVKEELKDYPEKVAQASKARYWEGVAKTYGSLLKYLGMRIDNNYDQEKYQTCVDGKDATVNRITREIVEKSPKYIEQDKRIKKLWNDKSLLSRLIDNHVDRKLAEKIFQDYHNQGGE